MIVKNGFRVRRSLLHCPQENTNCMSTKHRTPFAIVMLGARLRLRNGDPSLAPLFPLINKSLKQGSGIEVSGGDSRMRAVSLLCDRYRDGSESAATTPFRILTTGGTEKIPQGDWNALELSRADEAAKKLHRQYGIPEGIIESLPSGGSTLGNAEAVADWLARHDEIAKIEIVTNRYHMLRAWIMFESVLYEKELGHAPAFDTDTVAEIEKILNKTPADPKYGDNATLDSARAILVPMFESLHVSVIPVIVEDVLLRSNERDRRYARMIDRNPLIRKASISERRGTLHFLRGTYQTR